MSNSPAYQASHRAEISAYNRVYAATHREEIAAKKLIYREAHREEQAIACERWRAENQEHKREYDRAYRAAHPEECKAHSQARKARHRNASGHHTAADVAAQYDRQRGRCYWCGDKLAPDWQADHVTPLCKGGSNGPENLVASCRSCNHRKRGASPMDWAGRLL
jgi:5-methylcytosine-specific restriction endonuclease McrA